MGSYIQIDSISIDLTNSVSRRDVGKCEHFSIRGYVSEIRKKDWKLCWPFPVHESEEQPSRSTDVPKYRCRCCQNCPQEININKDDQTDLDCCSTGCRSDTNCSNAAPKSEEQPSHPPLDVVPKYRCRCCQECPQEITARDINKDDQPDLDCCSTGCRSDTNCSNAALKSATQQDPMPDTLKRRDIDLNTNVSCVGDFLPFSNEIEKKAGVVLSRRIDFEIGLEDNLNHHVTSVSSPKICPGLIQEVHTTKRGYEGNGVSDVELASNHKCMNKSSADIYNRRTPSADKRCQKELIKACTVLGEGSTLMEADNITDHTVGHPPPESVSCNHTVLAVSTDNMVENDFQDHHLEKSTALSRRRPRKVRLMTDLLSENGEPKIEQITIQGPPSHGTSNTSASQSHSIFPGKADVQGGLTFINMGQSRKRKFLLDEAREPADMCIQKVETEVQKGDAKTIDTALDTQSKSKDVRAGIGLQDAMKGFWSQPEIEGNHIMNKKNRKIQVINNHLIPEPRQGQQRENENTMDTADKAYASKTLSSRFAPGAFTGKGMDKFPFHALRTDNEFNFSKGKGKVLQTDEELDSLTCQKNDMLLENSFAYSGGKIMSNVPVPVPIPSAQGALNGNGLEEGLQLSLNSYLAAQVYNKKCIHQIGNRLPVPLPLQEATSNVHQPIRKDSQTSVFGGPSILSKHITNAISGKGARCEEIAGARNTEKTVQAIELGGMKRYSEQTAEMSEHGTLDDIPMEIVELLAKNQYERCLPDVENRSSMLDKSTIRRKAQMTVGNTVYGKGELSLLKEGQKDKHEGTHKKSSMTTRGENVKPSKRKPVHHISSFDGNNLGMNNLCSPQFPLGFEVSQSQKIQFSPMDSSHLGSARNCKFNGSEECGSSNAPLQVQRGCSLHKTILQQDDEASRIWANLSLGYDVPKKVVSQPSRSNMDTTSLHSGALHKQITERNIDLNSINLHVAGLEKLNRNTGHGTLTRMNGGYPFPCKHNGMEPHQNVRGSLDMYSNETIPAMHLLSLMDAGMQSRTPFNEGVNAQMLRRPSYHGDCSTKLEIGTSKTHVNQKRPSSDVSSKSYLSDKQGGCFLGSPTFAASSSTQHDIKLIRATGFDGRNSTKSGKRDKSNSSNSAMQNRVSKQLSWPNLERETPVDGRNSTKSGKRDKSNSSNSGMQNRVSKQLSWPNLERETPVQHKVEVRGTHETLLPVRVTLGNSCTVNRNPADFTMPETGNIYMIRGEDLKFEKSIPKKRPRLPTPHGCKQQRNLKGTKMN